MSPEDASLTAMARADTATDRPDRLFDELKRADVRQVGYVPDAGHSRLIELCQADAAMPPSC